MYERKYKVAYKNCEVLSLGVLALLGLIFTEWLALAEYKSVHMSVNVFIALQFVSAFDLGVVLKNFYLYVAKHTITLYMGRFDECRQVERNNPNLVIVGVYEEYVFLTDSTQFARANNFVARHKLTYDEFIMEANQIETMSLMANA